MSFKKTFPHEIECTIVHRTPKSWIIEMSDGGGKFFLPLKCVEGGGEALVDGPDKDGNYILNVSDWWWNKIGDGEFAAD